MIKKKATPRKAKKKATPRKAKKKTAPPKIPFKDVRDQLGAAIKATREHEGMERQLKGEIARIKSALENLRGQQEALSRLFLPDGDMELQEAFEKNLHGLQEAAK